MLIRSVCSEEIHCWVNIAQVIFRLLFTLSYRSFHLLKAAATRRDTDIMARVGSSAKYRLVASEGGESGS